jgi:Phosphotransferase system mannitol/fructose-specific IIA domain (Ntr-type)
MNNVINTSLVRLDIDFGGTTTDVINNLAGVVHEAGRATTTEVLAADALAREAKSATGVPGGVAIPHCRSEAVSEPTLAFARLSRPSISGGPMVMRTSSSSLPLPQAVERST